MMHKSKTTQQITFNICHQWTTSVQNNLKNRNCSIHVFSRQKYFSL